MEILTHHRPLLSRRPFSVILPTGYMEHGEIAKRSSEARFSDNDEPFTLRKTQADFLREFYPSGHRIFDQKVYPDIIKVDPDTGHAYRQPITRCATAFQQVIATKHTIHIIGNDVQFELPTSQNTANEEDKENKTLTDFKYTWLKLSSEAKMFKSVWSFYTVGDAALVGYISKGKKTGTRVFSYFYGDKIFIHKNEETGEDEIFARKFTEYDEDGLPGTVFVEVWDDKYLYRLKQDNENNDTGTILFLDKYELEGFTLISKKEHGFPFMPVAYVRNENGTAWSTVQNNIEDYEEALSYLSENNKAYGFPIFWIKGDEEQVDIKGDDLTGAVKAINFKSGEGEAGFLNPQDASSAFKAQLEISYKLIYELSHTVQPPELKSGDLPGVAVKLLFSPAIEVAISDAHRLQPFLDKVVLIVKYLAGYETNRISEFMAFGVNAWIEPYIHQNVSELTTNLSMAVNSRFLSRQTATERLSVYAKNDEFERILREYKEEQEQDLLIELEKQDNQTDNAIREEKEAAKISQKGQDVNTGHGRKRTRTTDKWGNHEGENNWDRWNKTH